MLKEGAVVENFSLLDDEGVERNLSDFKGQKVVIYFYPKDDTPGCTKEACGFRDAYAMILKKGAVVLGVSPDSPESHTKFIKKYSLPFHLLSDPEKKVIKYFGAWGEKRRGGEVKEGLIRSTFILDESGTVIKAYPQVSPTEHAEEVLAVLA